MSIIDMLLNMAVAATHRAGAPRPRTIAVSKDGVRRELRFHDVVGIAAKVVGVPAPDLREALAVCRLLREAAAVVRKTRRDQKLRFLDEPPITALDGAVVLDARSETCELVGLAGQHWANLCKPKLGTKTQQTGEALAAVFRETKYDLVIVDNRKDAAAMGFYLARRGLLTLPVVAKQHKGLATQVKGLPVGEWSEPTVSHG